MATQQSGVGTSEYLMIGLGSVSYTCYTFIWFSLPAFLSVVIDELGLSTTQAGVLVGAVPLVYIPLGLASGLLIDRIGSRAAIGGALVVFALAQIARGSADGFWMLLVPTLLLGVAGTAITFGLPKLVSELFPAERTGSMSSVYQIGSQLGPVLAFGLARPVLGPFFGGWRAVFFASGAFVLAYAVVFLIAAAVYGHAHTLGLVTPGGTDGSNGSDAPDTNDDPDGSATDGTAEETEERAFTWSSARQDLARVFSHRDMLLLVVVGTMYLFINHGLRGWLAVILEFRGFTPELAGLATSLLIVAQVAGTVTIPPLSDRLGRSKPLLAGCGVLCLVGSAGILVVPTLLPAIVVVLLVTGAGLGGLSPMIKVVPIQLDGIGPTLTATAVSFVYAVGEIGGFAGPFVIGAIRDATASFAIGISILVVASAIIILASGSMSDLA